MAGTIEITQIKLKLHSIYDAIIPEFKSKRASNEEKEANFLSKALASEALRMTYKDLSPQEAFSMNIDGGQDQGIDAFYFNEENNEFCFVQSKYRKNGKSGIKPKEVSEFTHGVDKFLDLSFDGFNDNIQKRYSEITKIYDEHTDIKCKLLIIQTVSKTDLDSRKRLNEYIEEQGGEFYTYDLIETDRLYSQLVRGERNVDLNNIILKNNGIYETDDSKAYYGTLSLDQLYSWWHLYGDRLTDRNLRRGLGDTEINSGIKKTLSSEPSNFWFYNNGLTLVADKIEFYNLAREIKGDLKLKCINANIVNGAQTFSTVGQYGDIISDPQKELKDAYILIKIIELQNIEEGEINQTLSKNITKFNNSQNSISGRDFMSFDPIQRNISSQLQAEHIKYYLMREENERKTDRKETLSIRDVVRALAFSKNSDIAIRVKREISIVTEHPESGFYKQLFVESLTGFKVWNLVQIHRLIDEAVYAKIKDLSGTEKALLSYARDLISTLILTDFNGKVPDNQLYKEVELSALNIPFYVTNYFKKLKPLNIEHPQKEFTSISRFKEIFAFIKGQTDTDILKTDTITYPSWTSLHDKEIFEQFYSRMNNDSFSKKLFKFIIENIYLKNIEIGYTTNLHFYTRGSGSKESRFLFRFAYYTKAYISFSYHGFGNYESKWLTHTDIFDKYTNGNYKLIINNDKDVENAKNLFNALN